MYDKLLYRFNDNATNPLLFIPSSVAIHSGKTYKKGSLEILLDTIFLLCRRSIFIVSIKKHVFYADKILYIY